MDKEKLKNFNDLSGRDVAELMHDRRISPPNKRVVEIISNYSPFEIKTAARVIRDIEENRLEP